MNDFIADDARQREEHPLLEERRDGDDGALNSAKAAGSQSFTEVDLSEQKPTARADGERSRNEAEVSLTMEGLTIRHSNNPWSAGELAVATLILAAASSLMAVAAAWIGSSVDAPGIYTVIAASLAAALVFVAGLYLITRYGRSA
ncbi:hypothetical protein SAMN05216276_108633 [Streptosporangium subroseum]|uniref:Uncharacterized protein n=1 Tax=Streptosporangium subroseum TaxID=106412 RepID=A0A239P6J7_9ACTN|nr:hypothetical protein [Streptosporangium subroseum]SNT61969.1 hypothetical protein SAMN05216276_108633 [Streptosporangium subroseum]